MTRKNTTTFHTLSKQLYVLVCWYLSFCLDLPVRTPESLYKQEWFRDVTPCFSVTKLRSLLRISNEIHSAEGGLFQKWRQGY